MKHNAILATPAHLLVGILVLITNAGCTTTVPELETVDYVDLERFMGDWYVLANIPTFFEKRAHNAMERYELSDDGKINTTFSFHQDSFDGPKKTYTPTAVVRDPVTNAKWGMQFVWPFKADYRVIYLNDAHTVTVIGRNKRDYLWIMARSPKLPAEEMQRLISFAVERGYQREDIIMVPQQ